MENDELYLMSTNYKNEIFIWWKREVKIDLVLSLGFSDEDDQSDDATVDEKLWLVKLAEGDT